MQTFTSSQCTNLAESTALLDNRITLKDSRDQKDYKVSKLADGNCWMVSNLALDGGRTLHTTDSNVTQDRVLNDNITDGAITLSYNTPQILSSIANNTTTECTDSSKPYCVVSSVRYGNLYNWNAATATVGVRNTIANVVESVCPKGWILPINGDGTTNKSYSKLMTSYGLGDGSNVETSALGGEYAIKAQERPLYFALSGQFGANGTQHLGSWGPYWTATPQNATRAYHLAIYTAGRFLPQYDTDKQIGYAVRCVFGS